MLPCQTSAVSARNTTLLKRTLHAYRVDTFCAVGAFRGLPTATTLIGLLDVQLIEHTSRSPVSGVYIV